jgi:hypothetical protein
LNWLTISLAGFCLIMFAFLMSFFFTSIRYLSDVVPALTLLAFLGFWQAGHWIAQGPYRTLVLIAGVGLACLSVLISVLMTLSNFIK